MRLAIFNFGGVSRFGDVRRFYFDGVEDMAEVQDLGSGKVFDLERGRLDLPLDFSEQVWLVPLEFTELSPSVRPGPVGP